MASQPDIARIGYRPTAPYALDLEVFSWRSLRARVPPPELRRPHRLEFQQLVCVTRGGCTHVMDFEPVPCKPGSVLVFQPSQTEQYDVASEWDGWLVLFRPEFLFMPSARASAGSTAELNLVGILAGLPRHLALAPAEFRLFRSVLAQMHADSQLAAPAAQTHALLRHQLCTLLVRLDLAHRRMQEEGRQRTAAPAELHRFQRFQQLLEQSFQRWHQVTRYANALGCTERTLTRATLAAAGLTAKAFIGARIALEAKRLLVHTTLPVATIADRLGFDDASNFVKFFKREAACTPQAFRRRHQPP